MMGASRGQTAVVIPENRLDQMTNIKGKDATPRRVRLCVLLSECDSFRIQPKASLQRQ